MKSHLKIILHITFGAVFGSLLTLFSIGPFLVDDRLADIETAVEGVVDNNERIESRLDSQIERFTHRYDSVSSRLMILESGEWTNEDTEALLGQVTSTQKEFIQDSWGVNVGEFYTDHDYTYFRENNQASDAVENFALSEVFLRLKSKLYEADEKVFNDLVEKVRLRYQKTWTEAGGITREAQTASGQQAQRDIADAIAGFLEDGRSDPKTLSNR